MQTIYINLKQVYGDGKLLENILDGESFDQSRLVEYWKSHHGYGKVVIKTLMIEAPVVDGTIFLPSAIYPNWLKEQYIPTHWNVGAVS